MNIDGNKPYFTYMSCLSQSEHQEKDAYIPNGILNCANYINCANCANYANCVNCENIILCNQAKVSGCEAQLFCAASERLICELQKAKNICEIKMIIEVINTLLKSSAEKELALAKIIKAAHAADFEDTANCTADEDD